MGDFLCKVHTVDSMQNRGGDRRLSQLLKILHVVTFGELDRSIRVAAARGSARTLESIAQMPRVVTFGEPDRSIRSLRLAVLHGCRGRGTRSDLISTVASAWWSGSTNDSLTFPRVSPASPANKKVRNGSLSIPVCYHRAEAAVLMRSLRVPARASQ
jgi:hypothetical protein